MRYSTHIQKHFIIKADILTQENNNRLFDMVFCINRKLIEHEITYSVTEKEWLSIIQFVKLLGFYLWNILSHLIKMRCFNEY